MNTPIFCEITEIINIKLNILLYRFIHHFLLKFIKFKFKLF